MTSPHRMAVNRIDPIVLSVDLPVAPARAFAAFTAGFADWWPVATHSLSRHAATRCRLDAAPGGAIEERAPDGLRISGARSSPSSLAVACASPGIRAANRSPRSGSTSSSTPHGDGSRVTLTHGGWEALGEIAPILRREYASGWQNVFGTVYAGFASALEN